MPRRNGNGTRRVAVLTLTATIWLLVAGLPANAQRDCFYVKAIKTSRILGSVFDPQGNPVSSATVTLLQNDRPILASTTDSEGHFHLNAKPAEYWLRASRAGFAPATVVLKLSRNSLPWRPSKQIYLVLGVGGFTPCPAGTSSRKELKSLLRQFSEQR